MARKAIAAGDLRVLVVGIVTSGSVYRQSKVSCEKRGTRAMHTRKTRWAAWFTEDGRSKNQATKIVLTALYSGREPAFPSNRLLKDGDDLHLQ